MPPWWTAHVHADRRASLQARGRIKNALRHYLENQGFTEVECGILQVSPGNETHLHAFATEWIAPGGGGERLYLHTSPEFACKKLLSAGEKRIFDFARVFRNRERSALHAPEFTMLEWYRAEETCCAVTNDCVEMLKLAAGAVPAQRLAFRGRTCNPFLDPERLTVVEAF